MNCPSVRSKINAYLDRELSGMEDAALRQHLLACPACSWHADHYRRLRESVQTLPRQAPPAQLAGRLRVVASRQAARQMERYELRRRIRNEAHLFLNNLMKPLALPFAGGLTSALLLFMALVPTFTFSQTPGDVPTRLSTDPSVISTGPIGFQFGDAEVDLRLDDHGRIVDYQLVSGAGMDRGALRRSIENNLLFTQFTPATDLFGTPVASTVRVSFRPNRVDVKG